MDLALFARVMWRFKVLVGGGLLLAVVLAVLSTAKLSVVDGKPTLTYRKPAVWQSQTSLLITQPGFPWGRIAASTTPSSSPGSPATYLDAGGLANLTTLYTRLATSDPVISQLRLPRTESVSSQPVVDESDHILPIVGILGLAPTPREAARLSIRAADIFRKYVEDQEQAAGIPVNQRIVLRIVNRVSPPLLVLGHKKTVPILAFLIVLIATVGTAFVLENLRPRVRLASQTDDSDDSRQSLQRIA